VRWRRKTACSTTGRAGTGEQVAAPVAGRHATSAGAARRARHETQRARRRFDQGGHPHGQGGRHRSWARPTPWWPRWRAAGPRWSPTPRAGVRPLGGGLHPGRQPEGHSRQRDLDVPAPGAAAGRIEAQVVHGPGRLDRRGPWRMRARSRAKSSGNTIGLVMTSSAPSSRPRTRSTTELAREHHDRRPVALLAQQAAHCRTAHIAKLQPDQDRVVGRGAGAPRGLLGAAGEVGGIVERASRLRVSAAST